MSQVELQCRNFKCTLNKSSDCLSARIELTPVGGIIDRLICVQATEPEESEPEVERTEPEPIPDQ